MNGYPFYDALNLMNRSKNYPAVNRRRANILKQ